MHRLHMPYTGVPGLIVTDRPLGAVTSQLSSVVVTGPLPAGTMKVV
jgi:hypothetical protein